MSSLNKIQISENTYEISPSPDGTLDAKYTSNDSDQQAAMSYTNVERITTQDNNSSIFSKLTHMIRNIRYLYNRLGDIDISAVGGSVTDAIAQNKNITDDLLRRIDELEHRIILGTDITVNQNFGGIAAGTQLNANEYVSDTLVRLLNIQGPGGGDNPNPPSPPSGDDNYEFVQIATFNGNNGTSDADAFFANHRPDNNWNGIKLGNYITINDGTYNMNWIVAGIDLEHNATAADGTSYDNGSGLCMIPQAGLVQHSWNDTDTINGGYNASGVHALLNSTIYNNLLGTLGTHIIERNVLLSNETNGNQHSASNYTWTKAYLTLMSAAQVLNKFNGYSTKYDDGEANYYLPLFRYREYYLNDKSPYWLRSIKDASDSGTQCRLWTVHDEQQELYIDNMAGQQYWVRPMMYLR